MTSTRTQTTSLKSPYQRLNKKQLLQLQYLHQLWLNQTLSIQNRALSKLKKRRLQLRNLMTKSQRPCKKLKPALTFSMIQSTKILHLKTMTSPTSSKSAGNKVWPIRRTPPTISLKA